MYKKKREPNYTTGTFGALLVIELLFELLAAICYFKVLVRYVFNHLWWRGRR